MEQENSGRKAFLQATTAWAAGKGQTEKRVGVSWRGQACKEAAATGRHVTGQTALLCHLGHLMSRRFRLSRRLSQGKP